MHTFLLYILLLCKCILSFTLVPQTEDAVMQSFTFICSFACMGHNSKCYGLIWPKYSLLIAYGTQALRVTQTKMQILTLNSFPTHTHMHIALVGIFQVNVG